MPRNDTHEPENRLIVDELDSVGLVAAGSNGASDILITKKIDEDAEADGRIRAWFKRTFGEGIVEVVETVDESEVEKARNVGEWFESRIHADFTNLADGQFGDGYLSRDERIGLSTAIGDALDAFRGSVESNLPELYLRDPWDGPDGDLALATPTIDPVTPIEANDPDPGGTMPNAPILSDEIREGLDDATKAYVEHLERNQSETEPEGDVEKTDPVEEVLKDATPEIRALIEKQQADLEDARAVADESLAKAQVEEDARLSKEYVEKAAAFTEIAKADEFGPVLRSIEAALSDDDFSKFESWMKAANATIESGEVWTEFGRTTGAGSAMNTAEASIDAKAKELVGKSDLSYAQAYDQVLKNDRDLAERLDAEMKEGA